MSEEVKEKKKEEVKKEQYRVMPESVHKALKHVIMQLPYDLKTMVEGMLKMLDSLPLATVNEPEKKEEENIESD